MRYYSTILWKCNFLSYHKMSISMILVLGYIPFTTHFTSHQFVLWITWCIKQKRFVIINGVTECVLCAKKSDAHKNLSNFFKLKSHFYDIGWLSLLTFSYLYRTIENSHRCKHHHHTISSNMIWYQQNHLQNGFGFCISAF